MDRLLLTSMAALVAGICSVNVEAQVSSPVQAEGASYTIAGDVVGARRCLFPYGQTITARDLLDFVGESQPRGNAVILRGRPLRTVLGENFTPDSNVKGIDLIPGDIVIFRRLETWQELTQNVVVVTRHGSEVLDFDIKTRVPVGRLPGVSQSSQGVTVTRIEFGSAKTEVLQPTDFVQHGDVVQVDVPASAGLRVAENVPVFPAPAEFALAVPAQSAGPTESSSMGGLTIPGMNEAQVASPDEFSPFELTDSSNTQQTDDELFRTASFQSGTEGEASGSVADEIVAATPLAASGSGSSNALWNVLFVLGLVFALGLIVIGWVKTQQERQHELESAKHMQVGLSDTALTESPKTKQQNVVADKLNEDEILQTLNSSEAPEIDLEEIELTPADIEPAKDLTDELWVETETAAAATTLETTEDAFVDDDCPILSAGFDTLAAAEQAAGVPAKPLAGIETLEAQIGFSTEESATEDNRSPKELVTNTSSNALVGSDEWFGADWRTSVTESVTADVGESEVIEEIQAADQETVAEDFAAESQAADSLADGDEDDLDIDDTVVELRESRLSQKRVPSVEEVVVKAEENVLDASDSRSDLEDLIHNRLPMELRQVDLPLQVSLFGRPSGPKRLRIDNAHTQIAAPHMLSGARRNRRPEKMAVAAEQNRPMESEDRQSGGPAEQGRGTPGLDKALNFIDERSDS